MTKLQSKDRELLKQMASDDPSELGAFEELYHRYSRGMFRYALNIVRKKEVCEDIVQEVFVDLWTKRKSQNITNIRAYLFQAVKYQVFNTLRNKKISDEDLTRLNIIDMSMNISGQLEFEELQDIIRKEVDKLPKRCQQIFVLSRFEHKTNKEIAAELDISIQAVKNQISKALKTIRQNLSLEEIVFYSLLLSFQL